MSEPRLEDLFRRLVLKPDGSVTDANEPPVIYGNPDDSVRSLRMPKDFYGDFDKLVGRTYVLVKHDHNHFELVESTLEDVGR